MWEKDDLCRYYLELKSNLSGITIPTDALLCNQSDCPNHDSLLKDYYQDIVNCFSLSAASAVPTQQVGFQKFWWSEEVDSLKAAAIEATGMWRHVGCPRSGPVNANRLQCKYKYNLALKDGGTEANKSLNDDLTDWLYLHNKTLQINSEIENYNVQDKKK